MPPHSVRDPMIETSIHHSTSMSLDGDENEYLSDHDVDDDEHLHPQDDDNNHRRNSSGSSSMDSDTIREQRRRNYEVCQTDEELFAQHNSNIQSIFDNRHHEIQFDQNEIQSAAAAAAAGGGEGDDDDGGSSLGGYSNMSFNDNSTQGSVRTREELRLSLIARRRRLAQLENALDGDASLDLSLKLNRSEKDGDNSLMSSVSLNESITDSLIARIMGKKKTKKKKMQEAAEKKNKSRDTKSSSKTKDRASKGEDGGRVKDKSGQKKESKEKKKKSKHSKQRRKDKEKSHKSKKSEKKHDDDKKSRRRSSRRHSSSSSSEEDNSSSSDSETDDDDDEYYTKQRRSSQQSSAQQQRRSSSNNNIVDKSRTKQMMTMGGKTIQKLKQMAPAGGGVNQHTPLSTSTDRQQLHHHSSTSTGVVYFACNEATGMCAFHPDVQLRKKSMFGGWNDVLKQCPKCMSESYSRTGGGGVHHQSAAGRRQVTGGGVRQSSGQRSGGDINSIRHTHPTTASDGRMRQQSSSTDQRGGTMYRGQVHPHQSFSHRSPSDPRPNNMMRSERQYQGQPQQQYPGAGGASSKPTIRNATLPISASRQHQHQSGSNQFYSSLHFQKPQDVATDKMASSRRQSYPDVAYQDSTNANHHLPQHYQHPTKPSQQYPSSTAKNPSTGRRAHFGPDPLPSSRPASNNNGMSSKVANNKGPKRVSIGDIEENPVPRQDDFDISPHHHAMSMYACGDEGRRRDMIEDTNEEVAFQRISNLKPGYPAFIKRSTGKWTYAKVKHADSDTIVFYVDASGSSKAYSVKHWTSHIRTLRVTNHDGW